MYDDEYDYQYGFLDDSMEEVADDGRDHEMRMLYGGHDDYNQLALLRGDVINLIVRQLMGDYANVLYGGQGKNLQKSLKRAKIFFTFLNFLIDL